MPDWFEPGDRADDQAAYRIHLAVSCAVNVLPDVSGCPGRVAEAAAPPALRALAGLLDQQRREYESNYRHQVDGGMAAGINWAARYIEQLTARLEASHDGCPDIVHDRCPAVTDTGLEAAAAWLRDFTAPTPPEVDWADLDREVQERYRAAVVAVVTAAHRPPDSSAGTSGPGTPGSR